MKVAKRQEKALWAAWLNEAFELHRFVLYTQPIVSLSKHVADHLEVLLRMTGDNGDFILPGAFIPAAERYNAVIPIDRWVIETVCSWLKEAHARQAGGAPAQAGMPYFINLSGASLNEGSTLEFIIETFKRYQVDADRICFEITETAAISNLDTASALMHKIKNLGCSFALDDFGSGFSSFAYLKMLPVDYLKIDGMFVRDIKENQINRELLGAINQVAHIMGLKTVAEYVEDGAILETVRRIGIDYAQGYAVGAIKPLAAGADSA